MVIALSGRPVDHAVSQRKGEWGREARSRTRTRTRVGVRDGTSPIEIRERHWIGKTQVQGY